MKFTFSFLQTSGRTGLLGLAVLILSACQPASSKQMNRSVQKVGAAYSLNNTEKSQVRYAQGFSIRYFEDYKLISVFNAFANRSDTLRYLLVPRGVERPEAYPQAQVIEIPIRSAVVTSTAHVALFEMLEAVEVLEGIAGAKYVYNPKVRRMLEAGKITSLSGPKLNMEKIIAMNPDLVMIAGGQISNFGDYRILIKAGIPVFVNADWLEVTPLGRAEWVKALGAMLNKEAMANKKFGKVAERYNRLKKKVERNVLSSEKPTVITNLPYEGAWFVPGGNSFMAQFLKDAGAKYPWTENDETGALKLNFEAVYYKGVKADIWINPGDAKSIRQILMKDRRFRDFKSIQTGKVYNRIKRISPLGGNDFWETGVVRPDLVLRDLINIFHPGLLRIDTLFFYKKLPRTTQP